MIDEQERTRMDIEELEREQGVLLPDRIEMRKHKRRRRRPVTYTSEMVWCPPLVPGAQGHWSWDTIGSEGSRATSC